MTLATIAAALGCISTLLARRFATCPALSIALASHARIDVIDPDKDHCSKTGKARKC
jgi:hypothetical protein